MKGRVDCLWVFTGHLSGIGFNSCFSGYFWVFLGTFLGMAPNTHSLQITPEILALIAEIDEFKGAWRALGTLAPERLSALRRVATIEGIGSSSRM